MRYFLSLGANIGNREQTLLEAIQRIAHHTGAVTQCSSFYYSEPWGFESEHSFCNICCLLESELPPIEVLHATQAIERALGRTEKSRDGRYADRTIDIDIIRVFDKENEIRIDTDELQIPHPLWQEREFVTIPLNEILT